MKQLSSGIKSVISIQKSSNVNVMSKLKDSYGNVTSDPAVIASIFNKYFVKVSHGITKTIKSPMEFMGDRVGNSFFTAPSTAFEISDIITPLKSGKFLGPNSLLMKILKCLSSLISPPLAHIINESFQSGISPHKMK